MPGLSLIDGEVCLEALPARKVYRIPGEAAKAGLVSVFILAWFFLHSWRGLLVYFSNDDIMNMYWARETPLWRLLLSVLVPFTTVYRPTGALLYRCLYTLFGLEPLPFRIAFYALLLTNLFLLYKATCAITGRRAVGAIAAFVASFHSRFSDLYLNNGTIYDVLCGNFYLGTFYYYISMRGRGRSLRLSQLLALYLLAVAALNSKEMAATLPIVLLLYELFRPSRHILSSAIPLSLLSMVMAIGTWARFRDASRLMHNDLYAMHLDLGLYNTAVYLNDLLCLKFGSLNEFAAAAIIAALFGIAVLARSRLLLFWALFILITPLPVLFIPHRSLYAFYIPVFGWAAFLATLLSRVPLPLSVTLTVAVLLVRHVPIPWAEAMPAHSKLYALHQGLMATTPSLPPRSRVLFLNDAFQGEAWTPLMFVRLTYNDLDLKLLRSKSVTEQDRLAATAVFDYVPGHMIRLK